MKRSFRLFTFAVPAIAIAAIGLVGCNKPVANAHFFC